MRPLSAHRSWGVMLYHATHSGSQISSARTMLQVNELHADHESVHGAVTGPDRNHARNRNAKCGIAMCAEGSVWLCISAPFSPIVISTTCPPGRASRSSFPRTVYRAGVVSECDIEVVPLKPIVRLSRTIVLVQVPSSSSTNVSAMIDVIRVGVSSIGSGSLTSRAARCRVSGVQSTREFTFR